MNILKKPYWSPYTAGIAIGLLQIPIFLILGVSLGTSVSFHSLACSLAALVDHTNQDITAKCFAMMKHWCQIGCVVGIIIGAYVSSRLSGMRRHGFSPVWTKVAGISTLSQRIFMAFIGGFIMVMGARIADGCTTGNGISGIALLSVGSMIVIASLFIGGIVTVHFYNKL